MSRRVADKYMMIPIAKKVKHNMKSENMPIADSLFRKRIGNIIVRIIIE